jgi:hypothetical protein
MVDEGGATLGTVGGASGTGRIDRGDSLGGDGSRGAINGFGLDLGCASTTGGMTVGAIVCGFVACGAVICGTIMWGTMAGGGVG